MPSMKCHQCGKVKRCQMVKEVHFDGSYSAIAYLCKPCARALGYLQSTPNPEEN